MERHHLSNLQAIKRYFSITLDEMKAEIRDLSEQEREELGTLCRKALEAAKPEPIVAA